MSGTASARSATPRVAVIGAGVCGMAAAIRLAEAGFSVAVHDPAPAAGGLAGGFAVGHSSVERFYHHLFPSDLVARRWIADLGLGPRLEYLPAAMGFFSDGQLYRFGTPLSLLGFKPLPFVDRLRLGLRIRSIANTPRADSFEYQTATDWLRARASAAELQRFWIPLLEAKFGADHSLVSMAWLWARFRARAGAAAGRRERLGYLRGGFQQLGDAMAERGRDLGIELRLGSRVGGVIIRAGAVVGVRSDDRGDESADAVLWTPSLTALAKAVPTLDPDYRAICAGIRYHHAVVMVVELPRSALPYYWVTVGDHDLPFTVAVEHTRLVGTADYDGRTIVYLGRYASPEDPLLRKDDDQVRELFLNGAARAFSGVFAEPLAAHVFRAPGAQPIVPPGWAARRPALRTGLPGLVTANIAQIYPWDRGINFSLKLGEDAALAVAEELESSAVEPIRA